MSGVCKKPTRHASLGPTDHKLASRNRRQLQMLLTHAVITFAASLQHPHGAEAHGDDAIKPGVFFDWVFVLLLGE